MLTYCKTVIGKKLLTGNRIYFIHVYRVMEKPILCFIIIFLCDFGTVKQLSLGVGDSVLNIYPSPKTTIQKHYPLHLEPTV